MERVRLEAEDDPPKNKGGRPRNQPNRLSQELIRQAKQDGDLPHEILLKLARGQPIRIKRINKQTGLFEINEEGHFIVDWLQPGLSEVIDCAKAAAPYFAPKLSTVEMIQGVSDDDLNRIIALAATEAGLSIGPGGESPPGAGTPRSDAESDEDD